jgi:hypothetical protein
MPQGLSPSRIVDVMVNFAPVAIPRTNFDTLLIMGDSNVIDTGEAIRTYNALEEVAGDFGTTAPEYYAAALFFSQKPQPATLYIGRWAATATSGSIAGGFLTGTDQLITKWNTVTNGGFKVSIDGSTQTNLTGINLSAVTNMNAVASAIQTALRAIATGGFTQATVVWTGQQFIIRSGTTGIASTVGYLTAPTAGIDLSPQLKMNSGTAAFGAQRLVAGIAAETPVMGVARLDGRGWYAVTFAATTPITDASHLAVSGYIEGTADKHMYGITTQAANNLDPATTLDISSQASLADYVRTVIQYCSTSPYAISSLFGRAFTVQFEGSNTTITMKFKKEPGVLPEILSATQADTLANKRCNVYVQYNNGASILQEGVMSGLAYFDEMHGLDWLANRIQTDIFNKMYQSPKIPQTNAGVHILVTTAEGGLSQGVSNGLMAPGMWNAPGFGTLQDGDYLAKGWFSYANNVDDQDQVDREQRIAPLIQIAAKLAGAVHKSDVLINVNR